MTTSIDELRHSKAMGGLITYIGGNEMTEKGLKRIIFLYAGKIKRLQQETADTIARKKDAEADLRTIRWDVKVAKKTTKKKVVKKLYRPNPLVK